MSCDYVFKSEINEEGAVIAPDVLAYDCDGQEIYEGEICRAIFANDIPIEDLLDADSREWCVLRAADGKPYAISVIEWTYSAQKLIREREHIPEGDEIPIIIRPAADMVNYELAYDCDFNRLSCSVQELENLRAYLNMGLGYTDSKRRTKKPIPTINVIGGEG